MAEPTTAPSANAAIPAACSGVLRPKPTAQGSPLAAFNRAKVVLNLHTWYGRWSYGVNPRLFEAGLSVGRFNDLIMAGQQGPGGAQTVGIVLHHQYHRLAGARGAPARHRGRLLWPTTS